MPPMQLPCCRRAKKQSRPLSTEAAPSLGDKIKASTASAVLAVIANTTSSFDRTIAGISVTTMTAGAITCKLTVHRGIENAMGALHGGILCVSECCPCVDARAVPRGVPSQRLIPPRLCLTQALCARWLIWLVHLP